ncbi:GNAT family N-acetyltransferase [Paenibacillus xerothermodurans]|uniref:GNAT family N-acetyltransferase n=1 Tax=Paenibacillus xerothermodurans TaxID=1977292 RepID=A0A2W1NDK3_PAEXE|nr:GNAT family N-acetyltransferase [Paenibacillus xerothermodurans]PZE21191.1 GNAT family N-acetyltransferase [Paenibacillus xerothermodurans]
MNEPEIRLIPKEQYLESLSLSEFAFQMELAPQAREEKIAQWKEEEHWGAYVDGRLAARMMVLGLHTWLHGKRWAMGGIASVATWPEYRRGGLVAGLLRNALRVMRENGQTLSYLHPFQFAFYRKFGWETYTETKKYEIPTALLPKLPAQAGRVIRPGEDVELLNSIYRSFAVRYNGTLDRDDVWWKQRIFANKKGQAAVYYDAANAPCGYVYYQVKERVCQIHELVALNREAQKGLWRFIADHDSMIDKVTLSAPSDDRLPFLLENPRIKQEIMPYFMARIVDLERFLQLFPFAAPEGQKQRQSEIQLHVTDEHAEWNNAWFAVRIESDGSVRTEKMPDSEGANIASTPSIACDIATLTTMMMSYQRPAFLWEIERLRGDEAALDLLEAIIPHRQTYLPDFF